ncbi:MAG: hypothetical protein Ct9H90mP2_01600 [Dehalococcoidia bacterium]|nr:MAG: hypothetical protein Ct9H90mP2_01600 [Dehalococcoidia bacterium]
MHNNSFLMILCRIKYARDVLREYVSKEYDEIADLYKKKKSKFKKLSGTIFQTA